MQLADTLGRSMGVVIDVRPLGAEPTPVETFRRAYFGPG
jgi:hypothetical protein